jgi:flagellar biosynthesis chaperone FliJ
MGLPKNFQQTVNLSRRVEALNDLTFYSYNYKVKLTSKIMNEIYDTNKSFEDLEQYLGEINFLGDRLADCKNRISALDREKADEKLREWLNKSINTNIIESYEVLEVKEKTFNEEITEKGLIDIINYKRD